MKKFVAHIPGFRTGILWKKVIAVIGYIFMLIMLLAMGSNGVTAGDKLIHLLQAVIGLGIPYILLTNIGGIRDKLPLFNRKRPLPLIAGLLVAVIVLTGSIAVLAQFESPQQKEVNRIAQQQREQQAAQKQAAKSAANKVKESQNISTDDQEAANVSTEETTSSEPKTEETFPQKEPQSQAETPSENTQSQAVSYETAVAKPDTGTMGSLEVHYLDVGQADSILIKTPSGKIMVIDAGNNADSDAVVAYLRDQGVNKVDVLIATHPHEDHIGGMDAVINTFPIGTFYMPKATTTTKTFEDVVMAAKAKGLAMTVGKAGMVIDIDPVLKIDMLAPNNSTYEDLNNYSIVLKLTYGNTSFLFAGDAEDISEQEMLAKGYNLKADVLKVSHHGGESSTTPAFLKAVSPKYAVISVGRDNDYGHPAPATLDRLTSAGVEIYRTDESGTIIATSDGNTIKFNKKASPVKPHAPPADQDSGSSGNSTGSSSGDGTGAAPVKQSGNIKVISLTQSVKAGSNASISVQGIPGVEYDITVMYSSGPSKASGLEPKKAGADGKVSWTWKVGSRTKPGTYSIIIFGGNKTLETSFEVK